MTPEYRLQMGPVSLPSRDASGWRASAYFKSHWRATLPANGWGPTCWHSTPEAAIDCLERRLSESYRP